MQYRSWTKHIFNNAHTLLIPELNFLAMHINWALAWNIFLLSNQKIFSFISTNILFLLPTKKYLKLQLILLRQLNDLKVLSFTKFKSYWEDVFLTIRHKIYCVSAEECFAISKTRISFQYNKLCMWAASCVAEWLKTSDLTLRS